MKKADQTRSMVVPERVRLRAEQSSPESRRWLTDLPGLLAELEHAWELSIGQPLSGGSSAYVAPVTTASGKAVIKLAMPRWDSPYGFQQELDTLLRADGHGYVRVLKVDEERRTLLLEQLGPSMQESKVEPKQAIPLLCQTLQQAWLVPTGADHTLHAWEYKAQTLAQLIRELWEKLERPCSPNMVAQALEYARRRLDALDPADASSCMETPIQPMRCWYAPHVLERSRAMSLWIQRVSSASRNMILEWSCVTDMRSCLQPLILLR